MKKIIFLLLTLIYSWHSQAQLFEVATCNGGIASNTYGPMNSTTNSSATNRTAVIYPASQLVGISGQELTSIYFKRVTASGVMGGTPNFKIYLKETTATDFGSTAIDWSTEIATATLVYDSDPASAVGTNAGWKSFVLSTPFTYDGTENLAVFMEYVNTGNTTTIGWEYEYSAPCISTSNNNTTKYINNTTGTLGASLTSSNYRRPWIAFDFSVSCPAPTNVIVSNVTTTTADLSWTQGGTEFDWQYVVQPAGTGIPSSGIIDIDSDSFTHIDLNPATDYEVYVRAYCSFGDESVWVGPINFTTQCVNFTVPYFENFDAYSAGSTTNNNAPNCWAFLENAGGAGYGFISSTTPNSAPRNYYLFNSSDASGNYMLVSPPTTDLSNGLNRTRFYARGGGAGYTVQVGTLSDPLNPNSFTLIQSIPITTTHTQYIVDIPTGTDSYLVFRHGLGGTSRSVYLDDIWVEEIPTTPPSCAANIVATPNATCGNFANSITWDATPGADGYYITIGTTSGGNDVADAVNIVTTSYNFSGTINTTYYYTVVPYNANGPATACVEESFTTNANGCYCTSNPTSNDGLGITNVQIGSTDFPNGDVFYFDHTATPVDLAQGINANVQVTFATGFTYHTNIWIDFNDDFTFDSSELVYQGESLATNPTTLDASFIMPAGAPLGNHRMRIGTADSGQATPNPCYSGTWGVTLDFTVNVVVPSCSPVTFNAPVIVPNCTDSEYTIEIDVLTLGDGTPVLTDGTDSWPINSTGIIVAGPYAFATPVNLSILHGADATCDLPLGNFNYIACPPVNDECTGAITLTVNPDFSCAAQTPGTIAFATASPVDPAACGGTENDDVWFTFVATATSHRIQLNNVTGSTTDLYHSLWTGADCGALTLVPGTCSDPNTSTPTGLTIGQTYYLRVYSWANATHNTTFNVCIGTPPPPPSNDECSGAIALTVNADYNCGVQTPGTITSATASPVDATACSGTEDDDIWYSFVATATTHRIQLNNVTGSTTDMYHSLWTGADCGSLTLVPGSCSDPNTSNPTGLVIGQTYYLRVYTWTATTGQTSAFNVCVGTDPALNTDTFNNDSFVAYPNPVKDVLNLSYTSEISTVRVMNMLGQEVISKNLNAANAQVDMSQLSAGTYIVNVTIGDTVKTIKVVKQ